MRVLLALLLLVTPAIAQPLCRVSAQAVMAEAVDGGGLLVDLIEAPPSQPYDQVLVIEIDGQYRAVLLRLGCVIGVVVIGRAPVRM